MGVSLSHGVYRMPAERAPDLLALHIYLFNPYRLLTA